VLLKRIEKEAVDTLHQAQSLYVPDHTIPDERGNVRQPQTQLPDASQQKAEGSSPASEMWGIGKSKL
jgi:hypothetical protein